MSNPYRAQPTRSRVAASHAGFGIHSQKPWNPGSVQRPQNVDASAAFQPPPPVVNQAKSVDDSWDWNVDNGNNGNDLWNWNVDQSDPQSNQQQQQQQSQQHQPQQPLHPPTNQFISPYANQKQPMPAMPPSSQENYYKNLNGKNRVRPPPPVSNEHGTTGRETPRAVAPPVREPTPKQSDSFPKYTNYSHNQQFSAAACSHPPRPSSNSSFSGIVEQHQWPNEHLSQSLPYQQPNHVPQHQKHQMHPAPPLPSGAAPVNSYNWGNTEPQQVPLHNWQNHAETPASSYWQEQGSTAKQEQYPENTSNLWPQQQSLPSETSHSEEGNSLPTWQQVGASNIPNSQWRQSKLQPGGSLEESVLSENNKSEWQQVHPPQSYFNSSTTSTTSGSLANMSSSTEQLEDRKRSLTPTTSCTSLNDFQSQILNTNQTNAESNAASNIESFHTQNNVDLDWNNDGDWNTVTDISAGVNNLNLNPKDSQHQENALSLKEEQPAAAHPVNDWNSQVSVGVKPEGVKPEVIENAIDNVPVIKPEHNAEDGQQLPPFQMHDAHPVSSSKSQENVSQASYDQWYKQNVRTQPENDFFGIDRHSIKQWPTEQNVENYENIQQQPTEFVNLEVVAPELLERDIYGSRDSINKETLDNDQVSHQVTTTSKEATIRDFMQETSNMEVPAAQPPVQQLIQAEHAPDNYEFASNDRNTFLETGELTDPHSQEHEPIPLSQDDENDEVPNDIPFLREVPGQSSSSIDPRRNDPTGQEQYAQISAPRLSDPRRNDPSGQEQQQHVPQNRSPLHPDRPSDRRDVPSGQERTTPIQPTPPIQQQQQQQQRNVDLETVERRNDPSGREHSLPPLPPPQQSRNEPSGEEQRVVLPISQASPLEPNVVREVPGRGNDPEETIQQSDSGVRQIPGGASSNESVQIMPDDRSGSARVVTGSQQINIPPSLNTAQDSLSDNRSKREEAVGAPVGDTPMGSGPPNRRDSYEDGDDEGSGNSRDGSRDRRREASPKLRQPRYDRDRDYDDDYYYDRRRGPDYDRTYHSREDLDRRDDRSYRDDDRRHGRDDFDRDRERDPRDRHPREDLDRSSRMKDEIDERDNRRRMDERRRDRSADPRRLEGRDYDARYPRDRTDYLDRDRRRDDRRNRRYPEYDPRDPREVYRRDYYDDLYARNSRPSSRSSYNDRDRDYFVRPRDQYSSYGYNNYQNYEYEANYSRDYYAYLENMRRNDPAGYAKWYHEYIQHQQMSRGVTSTYPEDRASVHSGRSSCDDRNSSDKRNLTDVSLIEDQTTASSRLTPTKFSTAHTRGTFSIGALVHVYACYPTDGERAKVDLLRLDSLIPHDVTLRELRCYPGPLIKGVTHKRTIIEYCESKIRKASTSDEVFEVSSYVLLYELMIMLIQQNGNVVGVDIASLLLRNKEAYPYEVSKPPREKIRRESTISQRSGASGGDRSTADSVQQQQSDKEDQLKPRKTVEQLTDEFRNTLLYGLVQDALEFAMAEGLWGHALFLASKLDKRTHASVMTRFANSLPPQDPLQTLYQLHSGRVPASVTCIADSRFDDWRPHLAMIISNTSSNPDVNRRSISTLGDTLATRGDIHAAHFCYILSQVDFGAYGSSNVKIVLIGANHHKTYAEFISTDAIMLTEIYEYARKLSEPFTVVELQTFKFNMAVKMADYGLIEKSLLYIEQVATNIAGEPEKYKKTFINDVYVLGDRLKYHDPVCKDSDEDATNLPWLNTLAEIVGKCETGEIVQENNQYVANSMAPESNLEPMDAYQQQQRKWSVPQIDYAADSNVPTMMKVPEQDSHLAWQPNPATASVQDPYNLATDAQYNDETVNDAQQQQSHYPSYQQDYWATQQQQQSYDQQDYNQSDWQQSTNMQYSTQEQQQDVDATENKWGYEQQQPQQPNISMGPTSGKQYDPLAELETLEPSRLGSAKPSSDAKKTSEQKGIDKKPVNGGGSWFGGLFSKLAPKPKNQMILPDDSNPSIVWNSTLNKWTNKEEEDGGGSTALAPPPKMSEIPGFKPPIAVNQSMAPPSLNTTAPAAPMSSVNHDDTLNMNASKMITGSGNMYKLSRSRNMRANYVDVMNLGGAKTPATPAAAAAPAPAMTVPTPAGSPAMPIAASSPQLFIPAPVNDPNAPVDFLTPLASVAPQQNENPQAVS